MSVQHMTLVLEASGLKAQEKAVLIAFCQHTDPSGKTYSGEERLMRYAGMPNTTFRSWRARLVERGLLISRRKGRKGGGRTSSDTWINLDALRAARDPFFGGKNTDRPEDENPFPAGQSDGTADRSGGESNGPASGPEGRGAMGPPVGPKVGRNGPASGPINGPVSGPSLGPPVGRESSLNPQGDSSSSARTPEAARSAVADGVTEEEEEHHDYDNGTPAALPAARSAAPSSTAEEFVRELPKGESIGQGEAARIAGLVEAALTAGWTLPGLRSLLAPKCGPLVRQPGALYASLLSDLPPAPATQPRRAPRPGACPTHPDMSTAGGGCPRCPTDREPAPIGDWRARMGAGSRTT